MVYEYSWDPQEALNVIYAESEGNPYVVNPYSGACGIWQHLPCPGTDLRLQFDLAYFKWLDGGGSFWKHWYQHWD